ncbi:MAG: DNA polymerase III subunit gamma/tau [Candidatus Liptonbacteria bacterium]
MSLALYRKYRPRTMADLLGQETTVQILKNAAVQNRFAHAYLFYGSRGTGKTTTARLIAKLLNCEKRHADAKFAGEGEPCNKCKNCSEIDQNNSLDVVEIDAASNRGIDEIRNLKENLRVAPVGGHYKVYIVDEVHMLTGPAFNALLKTLEEPPAHVVFVLATTEYEKLPATITSRTQRFVFKRLSKIVILEKLERIATAEKIKIDADALDLIAAAGEGSLRDAESLLDQIANSSEKIDLAAAEKLTGRIGFKKVELLTELILKSDMAQILKVIAEVQEEGHNVVQLTRDLIHYLRRVLSLKLNPTLAESFATELTKDELENLKKFAGGAETEKTITLIKALIRAYTEMRYSPFAIVPLEIALIENLNRNG